MVSLHRRLVSKKYTDSDIVKLKEQAILNEDFSVNEFDLQGNSDEAEKSCPNSFVIFVVLWLNLCNNNDQTWFFITLTNCQIPQCKTYLEVDVCLIYSYLKVNFLVPEKRYQ